MSKPIGDVNLPGSRTHPGPHRRPLALSLSDPVSPIYHASLVRPGSFPLQKWRVCTRNQRAKLRTVGEADGGRAPCVQHRHPLGMYHPPSRHASRTSCALQSFWRAQSSSESIPLLFSNASPKP